MKEEIGLIIQILAMLLMVFAILPRQLRDLRIKGDVKDVVKIKRTMFFGTLSFLLLGMVGITRMAFVISTGESTAFLDDLTFWANRLLYPTIALSGYILYRGNKYETHKG